MTLTIFWICRYAYTSDLISSPLVLCASNGRLFRNCARNSLKVTPNSLKVCYVDKVLSIVWSTLITPFKVRLLQFFGYFAVCHKMKKLRLYVKLDGLSNYERNCHYIQVYSVYKLFMKNACKGILTDALIGQALAILHRLQNKSQRHEVGKMSKTQMSVECHKSCQIRAVRRLACTSKVTLFLDLNRTLLGGENTKLKISCSRESNLP